MAGKASPLLLTIALILFTGSFAEKSIFQCTQDGADATKCIKNAGNVIGEQTKEVQCAIYKCIKPLEEECSTTFSLMFSSSIRGEFDPAICYRNSEATEPTAITMGITLAVVIASIGASWLFR